MHPQPEKPKTPLEQRHEDDPDAIVAEVDVPVAHGQRQGS